MRRVDESVQLVVATPDRRVRRDDVLDDHATSTMADPDHLAHHQPPGRRSGATSCDSTPDRTTRRRTASAAALPSCSRTLRTALPAMRPAPRVEERASEVEPDDLTHGRGHLLRDVGRAAGHVEDDGVGVEGPQPRAARPEVAPRTASRAPRTGSSGDRRTCAPRRRGCPSPDCDRLSPWSSRPDRPTIRPFRPAPGTPEPVRSWCPCAKDRPCGPGPTSRRARTW